MLNLAELARLTGVSRRILQHWADQLVLVPVKGSGPGTPIPRLFSDDTVDLVRVLARLAEAHLPVQTLSKIANGIVVWRVAGYDTFQSLVIAARSGKPTWLLVNLSTGVTGEQDCHVEGTHEERGIAAFAGICFGATLVVDLKRTFGTPQPEVDLAVFRQDDEDGNSE